MPPTRGRRSRTAAPEAELCAAAARAAATRADRSAGRGAAVPADVGRSHTGSASTQQAFGRFFVDLAHAAPEVARARRDGRARTWPRRPTSAAGSTASGSGTSASASTGSRTTPTRSSSGARRARPAHRARHRRGQPRRPARRSSGRPGRATAQPLLPIGTIYDPFVNRALEPWSFGMYAGGQSILVGTPSGVTLAPEGGAHQSIITPSVGLEQPRCTAWEPAFGQDLEWTLLARARAPRPARRNLGLLPSDHAADRPGARRRARTTRRARASAGGRCSPAAIRCAGRRRPGVTLVGMGAIMPEVLAAADELTAAGMRRRRLPDLRRPRLPRAAGRQGLGDGDDWILDELLPAGAPRADRDRARRPSAHAELPRRASPRRRSPASASTTSASPATSTTSTRTSASTPTRSSAPRWT